MSFPANPIANYRSYRYFHVLAMCDSTETAESLIKESYNNPNVWFHKTPNENNIDDWAMLGKRGVKTVTNVSGETSAGFSGPMSEGRYCVLINGATTSDWVITSAKWSSVVNASATPGDSGSSIATEGSLIISEPRGVALTDTLVLCCLNLGIDSSQATYVLKTFFVGWTAEENFEDASTATWISDIEPLMLTIYDLTGTFTEQGGVYEVQFISQANGTSRLPQYSKMPAGISLNLQKATSGTATIAETLSVLQKELYYAYERYYDCLIAQLAVSADAIVDQYNKSITDPDAKTLTKDDYLARFTPVSYTFSVDSSLADLKVDDFVDQEQAKAGCGKSGTMVFMSGSSIEDAVRAIALKSLAVQQMMKNGDHTDSKIPAVKYEPKILTSVSTCRMDNNKFAVNVHYHLQRTIVGRSLAENPDLISLVHDSGAGDKKRDELDPRIRDNMIEFDYLYTGKNIDILEFDIKMNLGLAYLQSATLSNTLLEQFEQLGGNTTIVSDQRTEMRFNKAVSIPLFFGTHYTRPGMFNMSRPSDAMGAAVTMASHASIEMADSTLKIVGNYNLLNSTNKTTRPSTIRNLVDQPTQTDSSDATLAGFGTFPSLAKINIKMPTNTSDLEAFQSAESGSGISRPESYAKSFWFKGFYLIYAIDHEFEHGAFTQTLHMTVVPSKPRAEREAHSALENIDKCNQRPNGCAGSTVTMSDSKAPTDKRTPEVSFSRSPEDTSVQPSTVSDSITLMNSASDLSVIPNWSAASPAVKEAIKTASSKHNIDVMLMARIADKESSLQAHKKNPASNALGLYQFIPDTWTSITRSPGVPTLNVKELTYRELMDKRLDPYVSAEAAALLLKANADYYTRNGLSYTPVDLYLAHLLGAPQASVLLRLEAEGKGHNYIPDDKPLLPTVKHTWGYIKRINGAAFKDARTASEARAAVARFLAMSPTGIPVTQSSVLTETALAKINRLARTQQVPAKRVTVGDKISTTRDCRVEQKVVADEKKGSCQDHKASKQPIKDSGPPPSITTEGGNIYRPSED